MGKSVPNRLRLPSIAAVSAAAIVLSSLLIAQPASADSAPVDPASPATPTTVTADALPTPQINGVVWSQKIVGNVVYAGGNWTTVRPAGSAAGTNTTSQAYLLAYNLTTGALITTFNPVLNAQVKSITTSPDGSVLYVGGAFTSVNGTNSYRVAALNPSTGALIKTFAPTPNATVNAVVATASTVYVGGAFSSVGSSVRNKVAALSATNGALQPWNPNAQGGDVSSLALAPDSSKVVVGGSFTTLNGSSNPGYGLAAVDPTSAAILPWNVNTLIRNGGTQAGITSLSSDADGLYGSGYVFGAGGNLEGSFRADWATGTLTWVEDCHGDTYSVATTANAEYIAGHPHYCGNVGGFPQTEPTWTFHRALAFSKAATGTATTNPYGGYYDYAGNPTPSLLNWYPDFNTGTFTGQSQGPWSVAASSNSQYVVYGGEFTTVNGSAQQGLTRFAVSSLSTNKQGPMVTGSSFVPSAVSLSSGTVRLSWAANWDRDNALLTYKVYRNGGATPVYTTTATSNFWQRPNLGFVDTGLTPGVQYSYRISATDSFGNTVKGDSAFATVTSAQPSNYTKTVQAQGASSLWRLNEASGTAVYDNVGYNDLVAGTGVSRGTAGSATDGSTGSTFSGDASGLAATQTAVQGPQTFSVEAWFKTTTTAGGKIVGFGDTKTGTSSNYDRHIYMDPSGKVNFGVYDGNTEIITSPKALNDGTWHQVIGTLSSAGQTFFVDGKLVGSRSNSSAQNYQGYWRVGGDSSWNGANFFAGAIDDVSVYPTALSRNQVDAQWIAAGNTTTLATAPADAYGNRVFTDNPSLYWRLDDAAGSATAKDASNTQSDGLYVGGVTQQAPGALAGTSNHAATLDGSSGQVVSSQSYNDPETYALESWFKTTTTTGGKIIGFGNNQTGQSSAYDRHVYMQDNGQLVFGTYTGQTNTVTTPASYNDGTWHYVVATQGSDGLKLYVDGALIGTNPTTQAQAYQGYWKVGGDTTWGSSSAYFPGTIDEVAVYDHTLDASTVAQHFALGAGGTPANAAPTSTFTATPTNLAVAFDGSASSDSDGTVASYAWDFGDGTTDTGVKPSHTYAAAGTYTVKLTVTDNQGATGSSTQQVTVTVPANQPPVASYTSVVTNLGAAFDATASSDPDGTVASYAWDFGDGATGTGVKPSHTYAAAGTYTVKLTVTDNQGATGASSAQVAVAPPANVPPTAAFTPTATNLALAVDATASSDPDGTVASYAWTFGDGATATGATASHTYAAAGTYTVKLTVTDNQGATGTASQTVTVAPAPNQPPVASFTTAASNLAITADGTGSTDADGTVASYAWTFGDGATATGATTSHTYTAAGTYTVTLTVTDNGGATNKATQTVTVTAPAGTPFALDAFSRTVTGGWGTANAGGAWTRVGSASNLSVSNGSGALSLPTGGTQIAAYLNGVSQANTDLSFTFAASKAPTGGGTYVSAVARTVGTNTEYRAQARLQSNGAVGLSLLSYQASGTATTLVAEKNIAGLSATAGSSFTIRVQATGTSPTTVRAKIWATGTTEPTAWAETATDSYAALQNPGGVGVVGYLSGSATNLPQVVSVSQLSAFKP
ncbi:Protease 1 [Frondihabitans sp. 762G35]|uniref:PKD domain-containing protein n=1 Tax=Frondihabitans sp. 762G35 TaxID=1446794 RepID=UPI000D213190|nr:PKD domain-containing protein [Frondihabitans sp. 762G35]ARC57720.1 Protease 1 [Frondihabitans sp. 762G35]